MTARTDIRGIGALSIGVSLTRCLGIGCRVRERCERHRQIGRDEMAPHGTRPDAHYADNLGGGPACAFRIVPAAADGPGRGLDGRRSGFPASSLSGEGPAVESALEGGKC